MSAGPLSEARDVPCPKCEAPPGVTCSIPQPQSMTPRAWDREVDGQWHRARICLAERDNRRMAKRGYSREFTPQTERRVRFEVDRIPPTLYESVKAKAKREGVSLRALTLRLWKEWLDR